MEKYCISLGNLGDGANVFLVGKQFKCECVKMIRNSDLQFKVVGRQPGLVGSKLNSCLKDREFESRTSNILDGYGVKAMPG